MTPENLVKEEQVCEHSSQVNRRVEIVYELRADGRLGQDELNRCLGVQSVSRKDSNHGMVAPRGTQSLGVDQRGKLVRQS